MKTNCCFILLSINIYPQCLFSSCGLLLSDSGKIRESLLHFGMTRLGLVGFLAHISSSLSFSVELEGLVWLPFEALGWIFKSPIWVSGSGGVDRLGLDITIVLLTVSTKILILLVKEAIVIPSLKVTNTSGVKMIRGSVWVPLSTVWILDWSVFTSIDLVCLVQAIFSICSAIILMCGSLSMEHSESLLRTKS